MSHAPVVNRLDRPVEEGYDHILGPTPAEITLVEYGSYDCSHCRIANEGIAKLRDKFGDRLRYIFRHRPLTGSELARRAAELVECSDHPSQFWDAHVTLMTRSEKLTEDDLHTVAHELGIEKWNEPATHEHIQRAKERVDADMNSATASGVMVTPTFFINGRRYDGPWDENSLSEAMLGSLGHRVRSVALDFASWAPSTGVLLLVATVLAVVLTNSAFGSSFDQFWERSFGFMFGNTGFQMSLRHWVNDALLTIFFLVVGLEIKREFTVGRLANRRSAALPVAGAIGGMLVPALLYFFIVPSGPWSHGWGVPMATDTAFAVALIVMLGSRVPVELRIFLTAAAIVDDIGAILVVALFYSGDLQLAYLVGAAIVTGLLVLLNRTGVYRVFPFMLLGVALWICIHSGGLHATLTGVILALCIPTRPPANLRVLMVQANTIVAAEAKHRDEVLRHGPSVPALRALDAIHDRIESPTDRLLRHVEPWSSYLVLPLFALANAGVVLASDVLQGHGSLMAAIIGGLVVGKPLGLVLTSFIAVKLGVAVKPAEYSWRQLGGAGALAGIGFTMSLFIAGQAFPLESDFSAAKIAVFAASVISAVIGMAVLAGPSVEEQSEQSIRAERPERPARNLPIYTEPA